MNTTPELSFIASLIVGALIIIAGSVALVGIGFSLIHWQVRRPNMPGFAAGALFGVAVVIAVIGRLIEKLQ